MRYLLPTAPKPDVVDWVLLVLFLLGIYLGFAAKLPGGIPVPAVLGGVAGMMLLFKNGGRITERQAAALVVVLAVYVLSVLAAPNYEFLVERFKGFVQLTYSLLITYAFFLAASHFGRQRLGAIFFFFSVAIVAGALLESHVVAFKDISDAWRARMFDFGVYRSDIRDLMIYGRIRPKLFTSEPSAMIYMFTLCSFAWYVLSRNRLKLLGYACLLGAGFFVMRGPTLLLGFALVPVYKILIDSRQGLPGATRVNIPMAVGMMICAVLLLGLALFVGSVFFAARLDDVLAGQDPSFFSRVIGPFLTTIAVVGEHPLTGAGLTGWEYIEPIVQQVYTNSPFLVSNFMFGTAAESVTNYFWLHWIFLGLFWGGLTLIALTFFLNSLGTPSILFCWTVWMVFGQASGGYVDPRTWLPLLLACTVAVLHERERLMADPWTVESARRAEGKTPRGFAAAGE